MLLLAAVANFTGMVAAYVCVCKVCEACAACAACEACKPVIVSGIENDRASCNSPPPPPAFTTGDPPTIMTKNAMLCGGRD